MDIINSMYGTVVFGRVVSLKSGQGSAASKLTIVTLADVNENGKNLERQIKVLFWNSERGYNLSDRARKLRPGELISCRVVYDVGVSEKAVGYELKKSGMYKLAMSDKKDCYILHATIKKIISGVNYLGIYSLIYQYDEEKGTIPVWYLSSFFGTAAEKAKLQSKKGDIVFMRGDRLQKKYYNNMSYKELNCSKIINIHSI